MVTHSRILTWEIPWTEEPGGLLATKPPHHEFADSGHFTGYKCSRCKCDVLHLT